MQDKGMTRRSFLKGAAAGAITMAALGTVGGSAAASEDIQWDRETDVLIIGGGGTGVAAAVEAAEAGAETLVIEKTALMGGSTIMSGGMIHAAGTAYQEEFCGVGDDSGDKLEQFYLLAGGDMVEPELVKDMAAASAGELAWCEECGVRYVTVFGLKPIPGIPEEYMRPRIHLPGDGTTGELGIPGLGHLHVNPIWARAERAGALMEMETEARSLLTNQAGEVTGAVAVQGGRELRIKARRGVVLASSGFDHNPVMAKALCMQQYDAITKPGNLVGSCTANTGDGIRMGLAVGAGLSGIGGGINVSMNGNVGRDPTSNYGSPTTGITVNLDGQRFVNEWSQYGFYMNLCYAQRGHRAFTVWDQGALDREGGLAMGFTSEDLSAELASGAVVRAESLEELCALTGISAPGLASTLERWNADAAAGVDTAFGKAEGLNPIQTPPYYGAEVLDYNLGSSGGLRIDVNAQVLSFEGEPIGRLFAGGLCTGGWLGAYYPGSGTAILGTVHWGRKAGRGAAACAPWDA